MADKSKAERQSEIATAVAMSEMQSRKAAAKGAGRGNADAARLADQTTMGGGFLTAVIFAVGLLAMLAIMIRFG